MIYLMLNTSLTIVPWLSDEVGGDGGGGGNIGEKVSMMIMYYFSSRFQGS